MAKITAVVPDWLSLQRNYSPSHPNWLPVALEVSDYKEKMVIHIGRSQNYFKKNNFAMMSMCKCKVIVHVPDIYSHTAATVPGSVHYTACWLQSSSSVWEVIIWSSRSLWIILSLEVNKYLQKERERGREQYIILRHSKDQTSSA